MTQPDVQRLIRGAQGGDSGAGHALLRHVTRSGDPTTLLLGLAAAARPRHRRAALVQTCAWWGRGYDSRRAQTLLPHARWLKRRPQQLAARLRAEAEAMWRAASGEGYAVAQWLRWNAQTCAAPAHTLAEAVALASPLVAQWPDHALKLPIYWRPWLASGEGFAPLRLVRAASLKAGASLSQGAHLTHPDLNGLERLRWEPAKGWATRPDCARAIEALAGAPLPRLRALHIGRGPMDEAQARAAAQALARAPWLDALESLHIDLLSDGTRGAWLEALLRTLCERDPPALRSLTLRGAMHHSAAPIQALERSELLTRLKRLDLWLSYLTTRSQRALLASSPQVTARLSARWRRRLGLAEGP